MELDVGLNDSFDEASKSFVADRVAGQTELVEGQIASNHGVFESANSLFGDSRVYMESQKESKPRR